MTDAAHRLTDIIEKVERRDASFHSVCAVIMQVLMKVLAAESMAASAAISLAQRERLQGMCAELRDMIDVLAPWVPGGPRMPHQTTPETSWWYALSEAMHLVEDSAEQLSVVVARQEKRANLRNMAAQAVRVLRDHYNILLAESKNFLDT